MNEIREMKLKKIMKKLNYIVQKDMNSIPISDKELKEFRQLEQQLKEELKFEHLGNGLIVDLLEEE